MFFILILFNLSEFFFSLKNNNFQNNENVRMSEGPTTQSDNREISDVDSGQEADQNRGEAEAEIDTETDRGSFSIQIKTVWNIQNFISPRHFLIRHLIIFY